MCKPWKINGARKTGSESKRTYSESKQIDSMVDQVLMMGDSDFKTPIGQCKYCGKPAYLVPSNGISRQICGCDADGYIKIGNIEMPASWDFNLELKDQSR